LAQWNNTLYHFPKKLDAALNLQAAKGVASSKKALDDMAALLMSKIKGLDVKVRTRIFWEL
jgi:hypothetical protein